MSATRPHTDPITETEPSVAPGSPDVTDSNGNGGTPVQVRSTGAAKRQINKEKWETKQQEKKEKWDSRQQTRRELWETKQKDKLHKKELKQQTKAEQWDAKQKEKQEKKALKQQLHQEKWELKQKARKEDWAAKHEKKREKTPVGRGKRATKLVKAMDVVLTEDATATGRLKDRIDFLRDILTGIDSRVSQVLGYIAVCLVAQTILVGAFGGKIETSTFHPYFQYAFHGALIIPLLAAFLVVLGLGAKWVFLEQVAEGNFEPESGEEEVQALARVCVNRSRFLGFAKFLAFLTTLSLTYGIGTVVCLTFFHGAGA